LVAKVDAAYDLGTIAIVLAETSCSSIRSFDVVMTSSAAAGPSYDKAMSPPSPVEQQHNRRG
jgi:hypothetical protein